MLNLLKSTRIFSTLRETIKGYQCRQTDGRLIKLQISVYTSDSVQNQKLPSKHSIFTIYKEKRFEPHLVHTFFFRFYWHFHRHSIEKAHDLMFHLTQMWKGRICETLHGWATTIETWNVHICNKIYVLHFPLHGKCTQASSTGST